MSAIDSVLFVSFGGPEQPDDIMPFLRHVTAGRDVPDARLEKVADQYRAIGGRSPINDQARSLIAALEAELHGRGVDLPVYWGNRNWAPFVGDAVQQMTADGRRHAAGFVTSAYSSYSSCRQYREDIASAQEGTGDGAPIVNKIGQFYDRPGFIEPFVRNTREAVERLGGGDDIALVFTAHSIPETMAVNSRYETQLREAAGVVSNAFDNRHSWELVFQSRSGSPHVPWLEPDVNDHLKALSEKGVNKCVVVPIGFISDHVEVIYDLDHEAAKTAADLGIQMMRASTPGTDPQFVSMIADMIIEEVEGKNTNRCQGDTCCLAR